jgi:hypothetical protein
MTRNLNFYDEEFKFPWREILNLLAVFFKFTGREFYFLSTVYFTLKISKRGFRGYYIRMESCGKG